MVTPGSHAISGIPKATLRPGPRTLIGVWLGAVLLASGGLAALHAGYSPLDDPNPAFQRPGFVDANPPRSALPQLPGEPITLGGRGVVFFTRPALLPRLLFMLAGPDGVFLRRHAKIVVIVHDATANTPSNSPSGVSLFADPDGTLSQELVMHVPRDHGYPVGYAVIGPDGTVRYRTEDPGQDRRLSEVLIAVDNT